MTDTESPEAKLLAAQFKHVVDLLNARMKMQEHRLEQLEKQSEDYEARIRKLMETATQFKLLASLATGGGLVSIILLILTIAGLGS